MIKAALSHDEPKRLRALRALRILDTPPEDRFDRISALAAHEFDAPIALISLIDENRQWFKSSIGMEDILEMPRDISFCGHAVASADTLVVRNAREDLRFAKNPRVIGAPHIRFYAGALLRLGHGEIVGTLSIMDTRPRRFDSLDEAILGALRDLVVSELLRRTNQSS